MEKYLSSAQSIDAHSVLTLFEQHVQQIPHNIAVIDSEGSLSYQHVYIQAHSIAAYLKENGVSNGEPVGVLLPRNKNLLPTLLAIWLTDSAYIPFDSEEPYERLITKLAICGCQHLLTDSLDIENSKQLSKINLISLDEKVISALPFEQQKIPEQAHHLAYFLFTSGSTGTPKAVEVEHGNVLALLKAAQALFKFDSADRYLASSNIAFDISVPELFLPCISGGASVIADRFIMFNAERLHSFIIENKITTMQTGPAVWSALIAEKTAFPRVKTIITTGEAIQLDTAKKLSRYAENVFNLYGPTETTVWVTGQKLSTKLESASKMSAPIGQPLLGVEIRIVDEHLKTVIPGQPGELLIGGKFVTRRYTNNEQQNHERFITLNDERFYRTGDIVVWNGETLHYYGRNDDQMQINGLRIEPSEIENAILKNNKVLAASTTWFQTSETTKTIVAAIVLKENQLLSEDQLLQTLAKQLPSELIPSRTVFLKSIPITINGKVDKKAIRQLFDIDETKSEVIVDYADADPHIQKVMVLWAKALKKKNIAPSDRFYDLGGDSLTAVHLMLEAEKMFNCALPKDLLYNNDRLSEFAEKLEHHLNPTNQASNAKIPLLHSSLNEKNSTAPSVFVIGLGLGFAKHKTWSHSCPLYSLMPWQMGKGILTGRSISSLAKNYIETIESIQPTGPYRIFGYSAGGTLAHEIAYQLEQKGAEVEHVFLLDPTPIEPIKMLYYQTINTLSPMRWLNYFFSQKVLKSTEPFSSKFTIKTNFFSAFWFKNCTLFRKHTPKSIAANSILVTSRDIKKHDWLAFLPSKSISYELNCNHFELMEPEYLAFWTHNLNNILRK